MAADAAISVLNRLAGQGWKWLRVSPGFDSYDIHAARPSSAGGMNVVALDRRALPALRRLIGRYGEALFSLHVNPGQAAEVSDRALRYRANAVADVALAGQAKCCVYCVETEGLMVHHLDGHEENNDPSNMAWACRSCNARHAELLKALGLGRRTVQSNPPGRGAQTLNQWVAAVSSICRRDRKSGALMSPCPQAGSVMPVDQAVQMIRDTPAHKRSEYNREIWSRRRASGRTQSRVSEVPF
ncbi:MAG: HNH endonuclease [Acidobacteria bacterium]|nr:HNH endonuclease [Acidobacteriota bacterium]